jgi:hypothetical protein
MDWIHNFLVPLFIEARSYTQKHTHTQIERERERERERKSMTLTAEQAHE